MTQLVAPTTLSAACSPIGIDRVRTEAEGWLGRLQQRNADATLPHLIECLDETGALQNLRRSADGDRGERAGGVISDADVYKTLEATAWEIARTGSTEYDGFINDTVALLQRAQHTDGYLNSHHEGEAQWSDLPFGRELYCGGHLVQAAIALARVGRPELLTVARKWADLVVAKFGPEQDGFDGHAQIEDALVELTRETGERAYLETALAMVNRRGQGTMPTRKHALAYFQDHEPVREATEALGQVVRALYLDAACVDLAVETGDQALLTAATKRWESAHLTKMYITGGLGSRHFDEAYGAPYELPASRAYAATSAAVADVLTNWRLLLATGEARYADAIERVLFNAVPAAMSVDGKSFFRSNPLQIRTLQRNEDNSRVARAPWVPSGATNLARLIASASAYVATTSGSTLSIQQWAACTIELPENIGAGRLVVETDYPATGQVRIRLEGTVNPGARLRMRQPSWCEQMTVNGRSAVVVDNYIDQPLAEGYAVTLGFPMDPRFVVAHPRVDAVRGCRALLRGPVLYCAEQVDVDDLESRVFVPLAETMDPEPGELPHIRVLTHHRRQTATLYSRTMVAPDDAAQWAELIPYSMWGNRRPAPMRVWLPVI